MNWTTIRGCIISTIRQLRIGDGDLLELGANERSLTHRLAIYLERGVNARERSERKWHVGCEYNRDANTPKRLGLPIQTIDSDDLEATTVYPDIIVHHRAKPGRENNLLV